MFNQDFKDRKLFRTGLFVIPEEKDGQPYLIGSKCNKCGKVYFPQRQVCAECLVDDTMQVIPLSRRGTIKTFSIIHQAPPRYAIPYAIGYVDLPEGVTLFTQFKDWKEKPLELGEEVELVIDDLREEGSDKLVGYKFRTV